MLVRNCLVRFSKTPEGVEVFQGREDGDEFCG